jgi:hypothetical protein
MNIPYWIKKRISPSDTIECIATGKLTGKSDGKFFNSGLTALVGTSTGIYFLTKGFLFGGHSLVGNWEDISEKVSCYVKGGFLGADIILEKDKFQARLRTTRDEADSFVSYIASKRSEKHKASKQEYITSATDIVSTIERLKKLYEQGVISEREYSQKKAELLRRL